MGNRLRLWSLDQIDIAGYALDESSQRNRNLSNCSVFHPGETVLVHAAAGGVGSLAVQLAKAAGAVVLATCGGGNVEFVRSLGADHAIDYRTCDIVRAALDAAEKVDVVLDLSEW